MDVNETYNGESPLMVACSRKCRKIVKLLVEKGADVNYRSKDGLTAMSIACMVADDYIVKFLDKRGAID